MFDEEYIRERQADYRSVGYKWMLSIDWSDKGCGTTCVGFDTEEKLIEYKKDFETSRKEEQFRIDNLQEEEMDIEEEEMDIEKEIGAFYKKAVEIREYLEHNLGLTLDTLNTVLQGLDSVVSVSSDAYNGVLKEVKELGDMFEYME